MVDKEQAEKEKNKTLKMIMICIIVFSVAVIIFSVALWYMKKLDTKEDSNDPKNAQAAARNFMNDTYIDENGNIVLRKSIAEWWEELKKNGNKITKYLDSAGELAKIMNAAMALDYPDTREHPDDPIVWEDLDINSTQIQGGVKFKRALQNGKTISMTYVKPSEFQRLMNKYRETGDESDKQEALRHFTMEKTYSANDSANSGGSPIVSEALKYACSFVGKVTYELGAGGKLEGGKSDCSHFVHRVFGHVGLMEDTLEYFDKYGHSLTWGLGGDNGGCPGTVKIGTDLSKASPGDVIWWHSGSGSNNHVAIYLGNNKLVECARGKGVVISNISNGEGYDEILHFSQLPTDPTGYFDPDTKILHSSISNDNANIKKVSSLQGMVFMGDSILTSLQGHGKLEQNEGAITLYQSGCRPEFFLGEQNCSGMTGNCSEGGYFNWNKQFSKISNPTGFYLLLGQNSCHDTNNRIKDMDRLIQKIKRSYPSAPIYMSSVLYHLDSDGSDKRAATSMNEELKEYCASQSNVYYSDILRGFNDNLGEMSDDGDHPNQKGTQVLINNIKENIISQNYMDISNDEDILKITAIDYRAIPNGGWGDGIMLSSNGYNLLMDTFKSDCRESLDKYLKENNITKFDIYISHDHRDHAGNLYHLIDNYDVSKVYIPNLNSFGQFNVGTLKEKGVEVIKLEKGDTFEIGGPNCVAEVIFGPDTTAWNDSRGDPINNMSLVTMVRTKTRIGDVRYLTGGDIEEGAAKKILEQGIDIKADIMKADHHGGGDTPEYIKEVNPSFYLIDYLDKYGSWVQPQVDAADECGNVFSTYNNGEVSFSIKGSGNIVPTAKRNVEQVEFSVQDDSGNTYIVTYTLNKDSSHILTERMKAAALNKNAGSTSNTVYKVKVATWSEHQDKVSSDDPNVTSYDTGMVPSMTTTSIPYQEIVSKYRMPFNYLWTMLVYSQDKNYTFDLADLVKNSKIEITIHDNYTETTNIVTDKYTNYKKVYTTANARVNYKYNYKKTVTTTDSKGKTTTTTVDDERSSSEVLKVDATHIQAPSYTTVHTTITRNNTLDIALTLADSWLAKYTKKYTYNEPTETTSPPSSEKLPDIVNDPQNVKDDFGGNKEELTKKAEKETIERGINKHGNAYGADVAVLDNANSEYTTKVIKRSKTINNKVVSSSYVSSLPGSSGSSLSGYSSSVTNARTGNINSNILELIPEAQGNGSNHQQGFCFAGDDLIVSAINHPNKTYSIYLIDAKTMQEYDSYHNLSDHGNSIAYDSKTGDIIAPEIGVMKLISINKTTKKFENVRTQPLPEYERNTPSIAYNANKDLFISKDNVYTRQAFYSNGKPLRKMKHNMPANNLDYSGATSFGNQVYYFYCDPSDGYAHGNYVVICNLDTGNQEETLYDSTPREGEEISFTSDGTLYICYGYGKPNGKRGSVGTSFCKTDYNYKNDSNIDRSNVSLTSSNDVSQYTTGGEHTENGYFEQVFNKHYNARSNILSVEEWLYDSLEQNSDTVNMIDITKYLIARAKGAEEDRPTFLAAIEKLQEGFTNMADAGGKSGIDGIQGQIYDYLLAKGVPPVGAAAIMGNIQGESSFKPDVVNSIGCSGLCQWYKGRLDNLKKLAASKGKNWTDVECQLDYLWEELNNKYTKVRDVIMAADQESELEYATWYWGRYFEVFFMGDSFEATKGNTATRYKYAQHWYQEWQQHHTSGSTSSVAYAHASAEEKVKGLFPNGAPQTREQAESYLTTINVPITSKDGTKGTRGVRVHRAIAQDVYNACVAAQNSGFKIYDIGGYRTFGTDTAGKSGGLSYSQHCYGLAVDINPTENGQFKNGRATGNWFYDPGGNEYSIQANSILVTTFKSMGWGWGGEWHSSKDYMHFSFMGT